jgi:hypothetical protein
LGQTTVCMNSLSRLSGTLQIVRSPKKSSLNLPSSTMQLISGLSLAHLARALLTSKLLRSIPIQYRSLALLAKKSQCEEKLARAMHFHKFNQTDGENCPHDSPWRAQHGIVRDRIRIEDISIKDKSVRLKSPLEERKDEGKNRFITFACNVVLFSHSG